jgi:hypothetical protein
MIHSSRASSGSLAVPALSRGFAGKIVDMTVEGLDMLDSIPAVVEREIAQGIVRDMAPDVAQAVAPVGILVAEPVDTLVDRMKAVLAALVCRTI